MYTDPFYAPIAMPDGRVIYGAAAYMHRVKKMGGPTMFAEGYRSFVDDQIRQATASNVVPFTRKAA